MGDYSDLSGFFCYKFEELGFDCYALENDLNTTYFLKKFKKINHQKFQIIDKSIFEYDLKGKKFTVVLALNVFHNYLQTKYTFNKLLQLLKDLNTEELFLQYPTKETPIIKNAYRQYAGNKFAEFIIENSNLNDYDLLGRPEKGDNPVYKLIK